MSAPLEDTSFWATTIRWVRIGIHERAQWWDKQGWLEVTAKYVAEENKMQRLELYVRISVGKIEIYCSAKRRPGHWVRQEIPTSLAVDLHELLTKALEATGQIKNEGY